MQKFRPESLITKWKIRKIVGLQQLNVWPPPCLWYKDLPSEGSLHGARIFLSLSLEDPIARKILVLGPSTTFYMKTEYRKYMSLDDPPSGIFLSPCKQPFNLPPAVQIYVFIYSYSDTNFVNISISACFDKNRGSLKFKTLTLCSLQNNPAPFFNTFRNCWDAQVKRGQYIF